MPSLSEGAQPSEPAILWEGKAKACTLPLLASVPGRAPELIGTGVGLKVNGDYFILTAGHVMDDFAQRELLTAHAGELKAFACRAERNVTPGVHRDRDSLDVAVLCIINGDALGIDDACLASADLDMQEWRSPDGLGFLFGYPCSQFKTDASSRRVKFGHFAYTAERLQQEGLERLERHGMVHVALEFDPKSALRNGRRTTPPRLRCVSGAGIWRGEVDGAGRQAPKLVAIFTDQLRGALVGTRVAWHAELIRMRWPEAGTHLGTHGGLDLTATPHDDSAPTSAA